MSGFEAKTSFRKFILGSFHFVVVSPPTCAFLSPRSDNATMGAEKFDLQVGAIGDVNELEYISALHQTGDDIRLDASIQCKLKKAVVVVLTLYNRLSCSQ